MAAPTLGTPATIAYNAGTDPRTTSVTTVAGGALVICAGTESATTSLDTPSGGTGTYVLQETQSPANFCGLRLWTAVAGLTSQTYTLTGGTDSGTQWWGLNAVPWAASDGIGAAESASGDGTAPSLAITTTQDNSAVVACFYDWTPVDGATRAWRTINSYTPTNGGAGELTYFRDASHYGVYVAYWPNVGAIGTYATGLTGIAPKWVGAAVEVKGTVDSATGRIRPPILMPGAVHRAASW